MLPDTKHHFAFWGTPRFAEIVLEQLIAAGQKPTLIICNPDRPVGRKQLLIEPPTKVLADKNGIEVAQPETKEDIMALLEKLQKMDFAVVAAYSKILPKEIVEAPKLGTIGVHPSLLPHYRGASPIQSAILAGEEKTGVSLYLMDEKMDHGKIISKSEFKISNENYEELEARLAELGGKKLAEIIPALEFALEQALEQEHGHATFTKKFVTSDGEVNMEKDSPEEIDRKIRALNPEPGVYTYNFPERSGKRVKLLDAKLVDNELKIKRIHPEGKNPIDLS